MKMPASFSRSHATRECLVRLWVAPDLKDIEDQVRKISELGIRSDANTVVVKENRLRTIYKAHFPFFEGPVLVKSFHFPTMRRTLRGVFTPYADRELKNAKQAQRRGIPVVEPLFLIRKREGWFPAVSLVGYRYLEGVSLYQWFSEGKGLPEEEKEQLLRAAGLFAALLHKKGGLHNDFHAGNLLVRDNGTLVLTDLYPLSFSRNPSLKSRMEGLSQLIASLAPFVGRKGIDVLLDTYCKVSKVHQPSTFKERILARHVEIRRHHEKSRSARCMKNSSQFYQFRDDSWRIAARRFITVDKIQELLGEFNALYQSHPERALKNAPESVVYIVKRPGSECEWCVKWYRKRGGLDDLKEGIRGGRALRAWRAGNGLLFRGMPVVIPYAMVQTKQGGFLIAEAAEGKELDRLLSRWLELKDGEIRHRMYPLAEELGHLLGQLHEKGIFHADLKACNIVVKEDKKKFSIKLLDYDRVKFFDILPQRFMIKNLVQLNNSIPKGVSRSLRFRFLLAYVEKHPIIRLNVKDLFRMVWHGSQGNAIVYVTDQGDREEDWGS